VRPGCAHGREAGGDKGVMRKDKFTVNGGGHVVSRCSDAFVPLFRSAHSPPYTTKCLTKCRNYSVNGVHFYGVLLLINVLPGKESKNRLYSTQLYHTNKSNLRDVTVQLMNWESCGVKYQLMEEGYRQFVE
jgi:hypothetical protein